MRILVVGAGMYVTGRGTGGPGTILPAIARAAKTLPLDSVTVCSTKASNQAEVDRVRNFVASKMGVELPMTHVLVDQVLVPGRDLSEQFDAAIVSVPDHLHLEIGRQVLEAGLHCLMVKPLAGSLAEGQELERIRQQQDVYGAVEFHKRFDEANLIVRRAIQEGQLGRLGYATVEYSQRIDVPRDFFQGWVGKTNIFQYLGVHYVDLFYFMTGFHPVKAMAHGQRGILARQGIDAYDSVHALVTWRSPREPGEEFTTQFAIGWVDPSTSSAMSDQRYVLVAEGGRIEADQKNRGLNFVSPEGCRSLNPYFSEFLAPRGGPWEFSGYGERSVTRFLADVRGLRTGDVYLEDLEQTRATFREALVSTAVLDAVNRSLKEEGRWQDVSPVLAG